MSQSRLSGMPGFSVVWFGQVVSLLGTGMTRFALTIWAWQITGQATALALVAFCAFFPTVIMSPLAGALVDRWNRKLVMILSDLAAGLATIVVFVLLRTGNLEIWHLYATAAFAGVFGSFQFPAYQASISLMLPKAHYTRANAMLGLAQSAPNILSPMFAGALLAFIGIGGILTIDIATFLFAIGALLLVNVPQPLASHVEATKRQSLLADCLFGFKYIAMRESLVGLLALFFVFNLLFSLSSGVLSPMILARSGNNELILGSVQMLFGIGGVVGGAFVGVWGGPKRRIYGLLGGIALTSLFGNLPLGIGRSLPIWGIGAFITMFFIPMANGSSAAIWQSKIPPHLQGRVFSARIVMGQIGGAIGLPLAGILADRVFEPLMSGSSVLARALTPLVGHGGGAGMGLMFVVFGLLGTLTVISGFAYRPIREIERILPDHDEGGKTPAASEEHGS